MKFMQKSCIRWGSCILALLTLPALSAQTVHIAHCLAGCPAGAPVANEIVVRHLFAASINYQTGLADWVAYRVLPGSVGIASLLPREWLVDELITQGIAEEITATPDFLQPDLSNLQDRDYRITEFIINPEDRGRLVPMSSFAGTPYWDDLNYLSNMAPIPVGLRLGPWSRLDQAVNDLAREEPEVFVVSGPLFNSAEATAGTGIADGPVAFFKFIATSSSHAAFVFPATSPEHSSYCERLTGLDQLQRLSGLELLPNKQDPGSDDLYKMLGCNALQPRE